MWQCTIVQYIIFRFTLFYSYYVIVSSGFTSASYILLFYHLLYVGACKRRLSWQWFVWNDAAQSCLDYPSNVANPAQMSELRWVWCSRHPARPTQGLCAYDAIWCSVEVRRLSLHCRPWFQALKAKLRPGEEHSRNHEPLKRSECQRKSSYTVLRRFTLYYLISCDALLHELMLCCIIGYITLYSLLLEYDIEG